MDNQIEKLILEKLESIEKRLTNIEEEITKFNNIKESCKKMNDHIDFIEETYSKLRMPLNFVKKNVEKIMGTQSSNLPIKDKEN